MLNFLTRPLVPALVLSMMVLIPAPASAVRASSVVQIDSAPGKFSPDKIVLHVGETTTLRFVQDEGVHGIGSDELGIPQTVLTPGSPATFDVTPKQAGTFTLHCQIVCGVSHRGMSLTIRVEN